MQIVQRLLADQQLAKNIVKHQITPARAAEFAEFPSALEPSLRQLLQDFGFQQLYSHQAAALNKILAGKNVVISSGVSSGKSLCYQLPILQSLAQDPRARALLLFPTKALAQDQKDSFLKLSSRQKQRPGLGIYDGDTPTAQRAQIRKSANIIFSNPDMLHLGILPHHTQWADFFRNLKYIVVDEVHIYRGIFGSHFANVIRRLQRIAAFYKATPQFILTSATISNADEFIAKLIETDFQQIAYDGSPRGEKHFIIYNPPIIDAELGIRRSALKESIRLGKLMRDAEKQTLIFAHTRRLVELVVTYLQKGLLAPEKIRGYRAGYLPAERRQIEQQLRSGEVQVVAATNAMELGIDIGGLDCVIINGFPNSIASTLQQSGRAGRAGKPSLTIFVATSQLIDQYLASHPEYLLEGSPEQALIDPNNALILLHHLQCAVFEKPFLSTEKFGNVPPEIVSDYLQLLQKYGKLHYTDEQYFWRSERYPAQEISLRNMGANQFILQENRQIIGVVDESSAYWMVHPQAVYLHDGNSYLVQKLDLENHIAHLRREDTSYYTQALSQTEFELIKTKKAEAVPGGRKYFGQIKVLDQVTGYKRQKWNSNEILGYENLEMPQSKTITYGYWISISDQVVEKLSERGAWNNQANDYGSKWPQISQQIRERDQHRCQHCGIVETGKAFDVHHLKPLRSFASLQQANQAENLITLCSSCHRKAEMKVYIQSGLAGLSYLLNNIAPLHLMCDITDIKAKFEAKSSLAQNKPTLIFYDAMSGGIGLSEKLYLLHAKLLAQALQIVQDCPCSEGCPACTGPVGENGEGAKDKVKQLLKLLQKK
ncbi:MAG: DEAD/DEAH box helicase [Candidatus Cloacimonadales bacterium]